MSSRRSQPLSDHFSCSNTIVTDINGICNISQISALTEMRAYYYDNLLGDQRLAHDYVPSRPVSIAILEALGVNYWTIPVEGYEKEIDNIAAANGYKNRDTINVTKEGLGDV